VPVTGTLGRSDRKEAGMAAVDVLFAGVPVGDFEPARAWYSSFFGRPPDVVAHEREVMWRRSDPAWLYVVHDQARAGNAVVALLVADLDTAVAELAERGIRAGRAVPQGDKARKVSFTDPDGNEISLVALGST
jgi:predicted enzyme related to lactoylglutathione lyase